MAASKKRVETETFSVTFAEVNALVASYMHESDVDTHLAGSAVAKVMNERIRRLRMANPKAGGSK